MSAARPDTWMPLYVGDYLRDTQHLSAERHGIYLLLIMAYWVSGAPLPDDDEQLAMVARVSLKDWKRHRAIIAAFFEMEGGEWRHGRIDAELTKAEHITSKRAAAGRASAQQRANKRSTHDPTKGQQTGRPSQPPSPSPSEASTATTQQTAEAKAAIAIIAAFDEVRAEHFGQEQRRANPHNTDFVFATRWLQAGADIELCRSVFAAQCQRMAGSRKRPPDTLKLFDGDVTATIAAAAVKPEAQRVDPALVQWRTRFDGWLEKGVWLTSWNAAECPEGVRNEYRERLRAKPPPGTVPRETLDGEAAQ